ncbi:hypothetical protein RFI_11439 [Reticulomyxa filosa]|uniref:FAD synthase n=1 Tax=Reticulomyxa filosa TaxID=46433 RepID=X6NIX9_RETFI|nr:hypothetical protein RFI_11439 [Reticulomyxa filosa]|eukprot:ETO25699.1 hypothetical protein RFI_11439 [Reticulomyxa filosa]
MIIMLVHKRAKKFQEFSRTTNFLGLGLNRYKFPLFQTLSDYKSGLEEYLENHNEHCKAILMGQRRSDPGCDKMDVRCHCSDGWPDIIRINPLLEWEFGHIWNFLLQYKIKYCPLYDLGYTSLAECHWTLPNPLLYHSKQKQFEPAFHLSCGNTERLGRIVRPKRAPWHAHVTRLLLRTSVAAADGDKSDCEKDDCVDLCHKDIPLLPIHVILHGFDDHWDESIQVLFCFFHYVVYTYYTYRYILYMHIKKKKNMYERVFSIKHHLL